MEQKSVSCAHTLASTRAIGTGKCHPTVNMIMQNPIKYLPTNVTKNSVSLGGYVDMHLKTKMEGKTF
jgi:hypothetical protein